MLVTEHRSGCPINLSLEVLGDRWSLIVIRDIMFGGKRFFRELHRSDEGIAFNILADRLRKLVDAGLLTKADDPNHKQKAIYSLTEMSIDLVPVFVQLGLWANKHLPVTEENSIRSEVLAAGGPDMWRRYQDELRAEHLGTPAAQGLEQNSVSAALQAAYETALAKNQTKQRRSAAQR